MPATRSRGRVERDVPKPRSDAYVGLLGLSLLALTAAMVFAYLSWNSIAEKPKQVQVAPKGGGPVGGPVGGPQVPPPGGGQVPPAPGGAPGAQVPPAPGPGVPPPAPAPGGGQPRAPQPKQ